MSAEQDKKLHAAVYHFLVRCGLKTTAASLLAELSATEADFKDNIDLLTMVHMPVEAPKASGGVKRSREEADEESSAKRKRAAESSSSSSESSDSSDSESSDSDSSDNEEETAAKEVSSSSSSSSEDSDDDSSDDDSSDDEKADDAKAPAATASSDDSSSDDSGDGSSSEEEVAAAAGAGGSDDGSSSDSSSSSSSSSSDSDSESEDEEEKPVATPVTPTPTPVVTPASKGTRPKKGSNTPFKRVRDEDYEEFLQKNQELADNSYDTAFNASGYGKRASDVLIQVRGKDFRHGKTKMKRGNYRGGKMTHSQSTASHCSEKMHQDSRITKVTAQPLSRAGFAVRSHKFQPSTIDDLPPGAESTREVGRSEMKLPEFWFAPDAQAFALVPCPRTGAACAFGADCIACTGAEFSLAWLPAGV